MSYYDLLQIDENINMDKNFKGLLISQKGLKKLLMVSDKNIRNYFVDVENIMFKCFNMIRNDN